MPGVEALCEAGGHGAAEHEGRLAAGLAPAHQLKKTMEKMMFALFLFSQLGLEVGRPWFFCSTLNYEKLLYHMDMICRTPDDCK